MGEEIEKWNKWTEKRMRKEIKKLRESPWKGDVTKVTYLKAMLDGEIEENIKGVKNMMKNIKVEWEKAAGKIREKIEKELEEEERKMESKNKEEERKEKEKDTI